MYEDYKIIGRVGRDPEMRFTPAGQQVANFSVAVSKSYTNSAGEKIEKTKWIRVVVWGKTAEVCNTYVKKGMLVLCVGELNGDASGNPHVYEKKDKTWGANFEMTAQIVRFLSKVDHNDSMTEAAQEVGGVPVESDIPF